jgi:hypothetical protein
MLDDFGGALERAHLAHARDVATVHFTRNLKFLYGSNRWVFTANSGIFVLPAGGETGPASCAVIVPILSLLMAEDD